MEKGSRPDRLGNSSQYQRLGQSILKVEAVGVQNGWEGESRETDAGRASHPKSLVEHRPTSHWFQGSDWM